MMLSHRARAGSGAVNNPLKNQFPSEILFDRMHEASETRTERLKLRSRRRTVGLDERFNVGMRTQAQRAIMAPRRAPRT